MSYSIVVYSNDSSLKADLKVFFKNRKEDIFFENNGIAVILKLLNEEADVLFLDIDNNQKDYFTLLDILDRMYSKLPIVVFDKFDSLEELRILKQYGVFYSTMKPVQFSILKDITESIKSVKFDKFLIMGGNMRSLNIALILSTDKKLRESLSNLFDEMELSYIFESKELNGLLRIMSIPLKAVFIEVDPYDDEGLNFIKLIKSLMPQLTIIAVSNYCSDNDKIIKAGADYCILRSVLETSKKSIVEKFNVLMKKENQFEKNEIN